MAEYIHYPSWRDVGIPEVFAEHLRKMPNGAVLDYLILNRVFRFNVRAQCVYQCLFCGFTKTTHRLYEDYSSCERCHGNKITSTFYWRMGKDKVEPYSSRDQFTSSIIQQMAALYGQYFRDVPPDEFVQCRWVWDKNSVEIPKDSPAFGKHIDAAEADLGILGGESEYPKFSVQFCCGEPTVSPQQSMAVCRAALLCPFLWDDRFDHKHAIRRDRGQETHILPLFNIMAKIYMDNKSTRNLSARRVGVGHFFANDENPAPNGNDEPMGDDCDEHLLFELGEQQNG